MTYSNCEHNIVKYNKLIENILAYVIVSINEFCIID